MDLKDRIATLHDRTVYIALREDVSPDGPCDFLDMDTVSTSRASTLRLATAQDVGNPIYADRYPIVCLVAYTSGTYTLSEGD